MSTTGLDERPWDRRATRALVLLVVGCLVSLVWLVHPWYEAGDETNDAAIYIACARSLVVGHGYSYLGLPFTVRPPGLSALIAPLLAWRGADFHALNLMVALFGVACVALLFVHARRRIGTVLAFLLAIALWTNAQFLHLCNQVMSDVPGTALLLGCILVERWADKKRSFAGEIVLGCCIAASTYVRSVVVLLLPAIIVVRALRKNASLDGRERMSWRELVLKRVLPLVFVVIAVKVPWEVRNVLHHPEPPVDQNYLSSYSTAMWHVDGGDASSPLRAWSDIAARVPGRAQQVLSLVGSRMSTSTSTTWAIVGALVLALALVTLARRRESAELFALAALGVLLVYFGFRDRLVLPIFVLLLPAAIEGILTIATRFVGARSAAWTSAALIALLPLCDFRPHAGWNEIEATHRRYTQFAADVNAALPPDARIAAAIGWHHAVFLDRPVYSLFFGLRRAGTNEGAERVIDRYGIDTVVVWPVTPADRGLLPWLASRHAPGRRVGEAVIYRVRP